MSNKSG